MPAARPFSASRAMPAPGLLAARVLGEPSETARAAASTSSYPETRIGPFGLFTETHTEPLAFVSTSTHRACGDPWLELTKDLGFFGQEDPAGTIDSTNRYQALGGQWNGVTDPLGLYEEDVHHYLTTYLARAVGFGPGIADAIGRQTGLLDFDERDAMYPDDPAERAADLGANVPNMNMYHFPMPSRLQEMFREATDPKTKGRLVAIGEYIHGFQDSFAHQRNVNNPSFKMYYDDAVPGKGWIGHGWHGHDPDHTWKRPIDFGLRMAEETYAELCTIYRSLHGNIAPTTRRSFSDLRQTIERFLAAPSPSDIYMQPFAGGVVWFENVRDYTDKIQRLDVGFSPTSYERAYREKKYAETKEVERSLRERADRRTMH